MAALVAHMKAQLAADRLPGDRVGVHPQQYLSRVAGDGQQRGEHQNAGQHEADQRGE